MRNKKFQLTWYQANDTAAMERKLEQLAAKGWLLEKATNWGWHCRRAEPRQVKYTVTFFPDASIFDGAPTEGQETYADYCAAAGWEFVSAYGPMQFFRSTRPNPTPIETDEGEKLQAIHKSMLKTWVLGHVLLIFSMLLNLSTRISNLRRDPISVLSSNGDVALWMLLITMMIYLAAFLLDYFIWYCRSKQAVERGESCLQPHTKARLRASGFLLVVCALSVLAWLGDISSPGMAWVWVYAFGGMAAIIALSHGLMALMKKRGCSRKATRTAFIITASILSFAYAGAMIPLSGVLRESNLMAEREPVYIHTTTHGSMSAKRNIYRDELPVTLEDLGYTVTEEDHCSYEVHRDTSVLMARTTYVQQPYGEDSKLPYLAYEVIIPRWGWVLDRCWDMLYEAGGHITSSFASEGLDPAPCGAEEAFYNRFPYGYCLRYEDRILILDQNQSLTEAEFSAVVAALK